ncbi:MAG: DegT/DnrJ/EryC1/StrS family aminotransferase [gamma proteobacterium symbiont of Taylorina sp.]|nr:DegT/DnrJ/EryC1/StrS family aminotransferase [gamma proteobacterium symbiont of Taylorina sp.]
MHVAYLDLRVNDTKHRQALLECFSKILQHGLILEGPEQLEFEQKLAEEIGVNYAVGCGSGSSALYLALKACGIKYGDEVITTPYTWIITANAISATGATPVFVDVKDDYNIDPDEIKKHITTNTKAIVPVHIAGHLCEMAKINQIADKHNLLVIEDAAQAFCSSLNGTRAGAFSTAAAFSMNPMKILHAYGESGAIVSNSKEILHNVKQLRHAGTIPDPDKISINLCFDISLNHKMDTIQAAFLLENLKRINSVWKKREEIAKLYDRELSELVTIPEIANGEIHGRYMYLFSCRKRNELRLFLEKKGIETKIFYSPLVCDADVYTTNKKKIPVANARRLLQQTISIPLHENMSIQQANYVVSQIKKFYGK